jgi:hypothetical protein
VWQDVDFARACQDYNRVQFVILARIPQGGGFESEEGSGRAQGHPETSPRDGFGCPEPTSHPPFSKAKPSSTVRPGPTTWLFDPPPIGESESISRSHGPPG